MSTPRKPIKRWIDADLLDNLYLNPCGPKSWPCLVIDLSPESVEAMAENAAKAIIVENHYMKCAEQLEVARRDVQAALASLGIKSAKGKAGK